MTKVYYTVCFMAICGCLFLGNVNSYAMANDMSVSGDNLGEVLGTLSEPTTDNSLYQSIAVTGGRYIGVALWIYITLLVVSTLLDLAYVTVPPLKDKLYSDGGDTPTQSQPNGVGQPTTEQKSVNRKALISHELIITYVKPRGVYKNKTKEQQLKGYMLKRAKVIVLSIAIALILTNSAFMGLLGKFITITANLFK